MDEETDAPGAWSYWAPILVPGICQTESYARALLVGAEAHDSQSPEERLAGRMQRQEILSRPSPPTVTVIMVGTGAVGGTSAARR